MRSPAFLRVAFDLRVVAFVLAAVLLLAMFRQLMSTSVGSPAFDPAAYVGNVGRDFVQHLLPVAVMLLVVQTARRFAPPAGGRRIMSVAVAVMLAAALAATLRLLWLSAFDGQPLGQSARAWHIVFVRFALLGGLLTAVGEFHHRQVKSLEAMHAAESDRVELEQQTLQARLKTLEAQIEPHFLFNVLANVRRLYETDPVAGKAMLARLMSYLQVALPSIRDDAPTLGREIGLVRAYLELQQVRMGRRLAFGFDVDPSLHHVEVPSMMLLTLVENALKHGLAPLREGGRIDIIVRRDGSRLTLEVTDDGRGFGGNTSGGGTGLANIRARLTAMFGAVAEISLVTRQPRGMAAVVAMPMTAPTTAS